MRRIKILLKDLRYHRLFSLSLEWLKTSALIWIDSPNVEKKGTKKTSLPQSWSDTVWVFIWINRANILWSQHWVVSLAVCVAPPHGLGQGHSHKTLHSPQNGSISVMVAALYGLLFYVTQLLFHVHVDEHFLFSLILQLQASWKTPCCRYRVGRHSKLV